ncbi:MYND-type domain-containing protein [Mycena indigotica]|uniref:MYND-type domain-containing protein n=1 Tax=Mycena indigotica TaxID=2126181 RepID=A0A8H6VYR5_9AGAR|nr:MYND-type domain-containing protein [Mycena indigotica]KAF7296761.1 MYND-type domain-containing protein [Mycena indigotica]
MHPLVHQQIKRLYELPSTLREIALAATRPDCTDFEYRKFTHRFVTVNDDGIRAALSAVFFAVLDPTRIPPAAELETLSQTTKACIGRALIVLHGLFMSATEEELPGEIVELCTLVIEWVEFIHKFHDHLLADDMLRSIINVKSDLSRSQLLVSFLRFGRLVESKWMKDNLTDHSDERTNELWTTPTFLSLLISAWSQGVRATPDADIDFVLNCILLSPQSIDSPTQLDILIGAAGGTVDSLVRLIKAHIEFIWDNFPLIRTHTPSLVIALSHPLLLLVRANTVMMQRDPLRRNIGDELLAHGFMSHVLRILSTVMDLQRDSDSQSQSASVPIQTLCTVVDVTNIIISTGPRALRLALRLNALPLILETARFLPDELLLGSLTRFLGSQVPVGLLYRSTLPLISASLDAIEKSSLQKTLNDPASPLAPIYATLKEWASHQEEILVKSRHWQRLLEQAAACDHPPCNRIGQRENFKRCSGCYLRRYCSKICQKSDWRDGNHRLTCAASKVEYTNLHNMFSRAQLAFFRITLHIFYRDNLPEFHCLGSFSRVETVKTLSRAGADPRPVMLTIVNYREGLPKINQIIIKPTTELSDALRDELLRDIPTLDDWIDRARRSNGRMVLHIMIVPVGIYKYTLVVPLRMTMSFLEDAALRAARAVGPLTKEADFMKLVKTFGGSSPPRGTLGVIHQ